MTAAALAALEALVEALCEGEPFASYEECAAFWARENEIKRIERLVAVHGLPKTAYAAAMTDVVAVIAAVKGVE